MRKTYSKDRGFIPRSKDWWLFQSLFKLLTIVFCLLAFVILSSRIQAQNDLFFTHGPDTSARYGDTISLPLIANGLQDINSMQFTLHFNPHVMEFLSITELDTAAGFSMNDLGTAEAIEGRIYMVFIDPLGSGATLDDGDTLMNVQFRMTGRPGSSSMFGVQSFPVELQAFGDGEFKDFQTSRVDITCEEPKSLGRYFAVCNESNTTPSSEVKFHFFGDSFPATLIFRDTNSIDSFAHISFQSDTNIVVNSLQPGFYISELFQDDSVLVYSDTIQVVEKDSLTATFSTDDGSCPQTEDGNIFLQSVQNGLGPYTVIWPNGILHYREYNDIKPGTYEITIIDAQRCETEFIVEVGGPEAEVNETVRPVSCPGVSDGRLIVDVLNLPRFPDSSLLFSLDSNQYFRDVNFKAFSMSQGPLTYFIKDANGCVYKKETFILSENEIFLQNTITQNPSCFNSFDGEISIIAALRNDIDGNFSFEWSGNSGATFPNDSAFTATQLSGGTYELTITHSGLHQNCELTRTFQLAEADTIRATIDSLSDEKCFGNSDGYISISSEGGALPHTYQWSTGDTTATISNLAAGQYYVTVEDANLCTIVDSFLVDTGLLIEFTDLITTDNTCFGDAEGSMNAVINTRFGYENTPLSYIITPIVEGSIPLMNDTIRFFELTAGRYNLTVQDTTGCSFDTVFQISQGDSIGIEVTEIQIPNCEENNGLLRVQANGGNDTLYSYRWSDESDSNLISNITPGFYELTVTDGAGCSKTDSIELPAPVPPSLSHTTIVDVECHGATDGFIAIELDTGTFPITGVSWESGDTSLIRTDLSAGIYSLTVTDSGNCRLIEDFVVQEPDSIRIRFEVIPDSNGNGMGAAIAIVNGGTPPYSFVWNTSPIQTDSIADQVPVGIYQVLVRDDNGCTATAMVEVPMNTLVSYHQANSLIIFPNPSSGELNLKLNSTSNLLPEKLTVRDLNGRIIRSLQWAPGQSDYQLFLQSSGIYIIEVLYINGMSEHQAVYIQQ